MDQEAFERQGEQYGRVLQVSSHKDEESFRIL